MMPRDNFVLQALRIKGTMRGREGSEIKVQCQDAQLVG